MSTIPPGHGARIKDVGFFHLPDDAVLVLSDPDNSDDLIVLEVDGKSTLDDGTSYLALTRTDVVVHDTID